MHSEGYDFTPMTKLKKNKEKLTFIWEGKIAKNNITILAAPGDSGKSALVLYLMNRFAGEGWKIAMIDAEAFTEQWIERMNTWDLPHLDKVFVLTKKKSYKGNNNEFQDDLTTGSPEEFKHLKEKIISLKPDLLVIDSLTEIEPDLTNPTKIAELQKSFAKIQEQTGTAILVISHTRKNIQGVKQEIRPDEVLGAQKITSKSRSVLMIGKDEDNPNLRYIHTPKHNLAGPQPTCSFEFSDTGEVINFNEKVEIKPPIRMDKKKAERIRDKAKQLIEDGITDWTEINKILKDDLKATPTECNRAKEQLSKAGIII